MRKGEAERLRRLTEGHKHAERLFLEQVWWPSFGHFDDLHPEYEISDFRGGTRFLDFAYVRNSLRLVLEIDGYGPHLQQMSRTQFSDQWIRKNHLIIDGWKILRFSFDDVKERPRMCEQMIGQFIGRWFGGKMISTDELSSEQKDILRFANRTNGSFVPRDVCRLLNVEQQKARKLLRSLLQKGYLTPGGQGRSRIYCYRLSDTVKVDYLNL